MVIKMTMKEIEKRSGLTRTAIYLMCKHCGMITTFFTMPTGLLPNCAWCNSIKGYELIEPVEIKSEKEE